MLRRFTVSGFLACVTLVPLQAETLRVPSSHPMIQAAIDAARDGDTVLIAPGTYRESLALPGGTYTGRAPDLGAFEVTGR